MFQSLSCLKINRWTEKQGWKPFVTPRLFLTSQGLERVSVNKSNPKRKIKNLLRRSSFMTFTSFHIFLWSFSFVLWFWVSVVMAIICVHEQWDIWHLSYHNFGLGCLLRRSQNTLEHFAACFCQMIKRNIY